MQLTPQAVRVLGALAEKRLTTPQQYPLTLAALVGACNQRSARDPVMELTEGQVQQALRELREHELSRTAGVRGRVPRYEHRLDLQLDLADADQAVLGVLLLRGPQTVGEIRTRSERWADLGELDDVEARLGALATHHLLPLVTEMEREPGRRETRWAHRLGDTDPGTPSVAPTPATPAPSVASRPDVTTSAAPSAPSDADAPSHDGGDLAGRVAALEDVVERLRDDLAELRTALGE